MEINTENIEELILLFVDEEMSGEQAGQLMDFILRHPEYDSLLKSYAAAKPDPEDKLVFPDKVLLIRKENKAIPFYRSGGLIARVAAVLILGILGIAFLWKANQVPGSQHQISLQQPLPPGQGQIPETSEVKERPRNELAGTTAPAPKLKVKPVPAVATHFPPASQEAMDDTADKQKVIAEQIKIRPAPVPEQPLESIPKQPELLAQNNSPDPALVTKIEEKQLLAIPTWIPMEEERFQGINDLIGQVRATKEKIEERIAMLKHSSFILQIGEKEISIGNKESM